MHSCVLHMNKYRLFREVTVGKGLILWDSFAGWSVLMHFHSQTSTKNISPPPPHLLLRLCFTLGETRNPAPWSKFRAENRYCQLQMQPHTQADIWFVQEELLKLQVWFCRRNICAFVFPWGTMTFPRAGAAQLCSQPGPGTELQPPRGGRGWVLSPQRCLPGMLFFCSRWFSRWFLTSSLATVHIYRQIKDSNKRLFN